MFIFGSRTQTYLFAQAAPLNHTGRNFLELVPKKFRNHDSCKLVENRFGIPPELQYLLQLPPATDC